MKTYRKLISALSSPKTLLSLICVSLCAVSSRAQTVNAQQQVVLQGLRSSSAHGSFTAAKFAPDGSLILLLDEGDGIRVLKTDSTSTNVLAQAQAGSIGDSALALAIDPSGNIYVTGTTTSATLTGTSAAVFPTRADTSTNSFLAKYDTNLNLLFLTFLGAGRTAAASVAATSDAVFVTGITFNPAFPVTAAGIQQTPAPGSSENGFVERFNTSGSSLVYATYLTGANGNTVPTAIVADSSDNAYITGSTSATGFPTVAALQSAILGANSGLLTKLNPSGSALVYSTFLAGQGISGLAMDAATSSILLTGNIAMGQFPVATVTTPLTSASYQTLLRIPLDGQSRNLLRSAAPRLAELRQRRSQRRRLDLRRLDDPSLPRRTAARLLRRRQLPPPPHRRQHLRPDAALRRHCRQQRQLRHSHQYRRGARGQRVRRQRNHPRKGNGHDEHIAASTQRFDLPSVQVPTSVLPNTLRDIVPTTAACGISSQCSGTGALLATVSTAASAPALSLSSDDLPNLTLRNMGSATANGLSISASGFTLTTNCGATLLPSNQCSLALTGTGPGTLTVSAANASTTTLSLPANTLTPDAIVLSTSQLDFGIETSASPPATETITVSNLSTTSQTFTSAKDGIASTPERPSRRPPATASPEARQGFMSWPRAVRATSRLDLPSPPSSTNDGPVRETWKIGPRDVVLTGFAQASPLNVSATEVDFGTQISGSSVVLPRYLYLSNNSTTAVPTARRRCPAARPSACWTPVLPPSPRTPSAA